MPFVLRLGEDEQRGIVSKLASATCNDCYFRRAGLCALPGDTPCPTFRAHTRGSLAPPLQPRLVPRALGALATQHAAA
jgi:hypothetical protein